MIAAYSNVVNKYLQGQITQNDLIGFSTFQTFEETLASAARVDKDRALPEGISKHLLVQVRSYNSYGSAERRSSLDDKKMIVVRM